MMEEQILNVKAIAATGANSVPLPTLYRQMLPWGLAGEKGDRELEGGDTDIRTTRTVGQTTKIEYAVFLVNWELGMQAGQIFHTLVNMAARQGNCQFQVSDALLAQWARVSPEVARRYLWRLSEAGYAAWRKTTNGHHKPVTDHFKAQPFIEVTSGSIGPGRVVTVRLAAPFCGELAERGTTTESAPKTRRRLRH